MGRRYAAIWFRHLLADRMTRRQPELKDQAFVIAAPERGRMVIKAVTEAAKNKGIDEGMVVADCRAIFPSLQVFDEKPGQAEKLLNALAEWCIRYTPVVATDHPDGLLLDISGCAHLWGGEENYLTDILSKLGAYGYDVRGAIADTIGCAWAICHYSKHTAIVNPEGQLMALSSLPPSALRLETGITERLIKLGLYTIGNLLTMPPRVLKRRFGGSLLARLNQALGYEMEIIEPVIPLQPYQERLPSLEPIRTAAGIEIALRRLLETLCLRLSKEQKGLRKAIFKGYRIDGMIQQIDIGTSKASRNVEHLFGLFELKIATIEPDLGIELFILEAPIVEDLSPEQEALWNDVGSHDEKMIAELLDRLAGKVGAHAINRYLPQEHHWPERSIRTAASLLEQRHTAWRTDLQRPIHLLPIPEQIQVTVPLPDYPPILFIHKGILHQVRKADGPERIEQEWWIEDGEHRDYYCVEDEKGGRYWLFREGHYASSEPRWFIHGFFA